MVKKRNQFIFQPIPYEILHFSFCQFTQAADQTLFRGTLDTLNTLIQIFSNWHSHAGFHDSFID